MREAPHWQRDLFLSGFCLPEKVLAHRTCEANESPGMKEKNPHAVAMGKMKSDKKTVAVRENGKKGGRPKKDICKRCGHSEIFHVMLIAQCDKPGCSCGGYC